MKSHSLLTPLHHAIKRKYVLYLLLLLLLHKCCTTVNEAGANLEDVLTKEKTTEETKNKYKQVYGSFVVKVTLCTRFFLCFV